MTAKEQATQRIKQLILDIYDDEFSWAGKLFKKFIKVDRVVLYANRIMDISEDYTDKRLEEVEKRLKTLENKMLLLGRF